MADQDSPRAQQIISAACELLEAEGPDALTMRRIAEVVGMRAPSLYKHFPDKQAVETRLVAQAMADLADTLEAAEAGGLSALTEAYRAYACAHPHLYRLMSDRPLPRQELPEGLEDRAAAPLVRVVDFDEHRARAVWAFAHGMVALELNGRFPPGAELDKAWRTGVSSFSAPLSRAPIPTAAPSLLHQHNQAVGRRD